jgi:hypothetical protein
MEQVAQAMDSIKQASTQSVESARQLEDSARDLTSLGTRLQQQLERYSMDGNDTRASHPGSHSEHHNGGRHQVARRTA